MAKPIAYPSFRQPRLVTCGTGSIRTFAGSPPAGVTAFFITGHTGARAAIEASFQKAGTSLDPSQVLVKPAGEPDHAMVTLGAAFLKSRPFTRIVGIGGGSVLDWCRLSWAESGLQRPDIWLAPTTCATGAEAAGVAVFTRNGQKVPVVCSGFIADHVVLDGQFLAGLPRHELSSFLCDAMSHAIEAYCSIVPSTLAKQAAVSALRLILDHWPTAPSSCRNQQLMEAAYLGGVAASNCSVGVVHAFAHTVASYGVTHATGNAAGLLAGIATNASDPSVADLAERCGAGDVDGLMSRVAPIVQEALSGAGAGTIRQLVHDASRRDEIVNRMSGDVCLRSNPVRLDASGLDAFLTRVVEQVA